MIAINFTVFVILGMFLLFLWVTQKLILQPILDVMDRRDAQVESDENAAEQHTAEADTLESRYAEEIARVRRAASMEIDQARRDGMLARADAIRDRKAVAEREVRTVEEVAREALEVERKQFESLVPGLAVELARQLKLGGGS